VVGARSGGPVAGGGRRLGGVPASGEAGGEGLEVADGPADGVGLVRAVAAQLLDRRGRPRARSSSHRSTNRNTRES